MMHTTIYWIHGRRQKMASLGTMRHMIIRKCKLDTEESYPMYNGLKLQLTESEGHSFGVDSICVFRWQEL